jgi:hypothetical protein
MIIFKILLIITINIGCIWALYAMYKKFMAKKVMDRSESGHRFYTTDDYRSYDVLVALEFFYKNRQLFLEVCENFNTYCVDKDAFILDIYTYIESQPNLRFSYKYSETIEDYIWTKNAFFTWDSNTTAFSKQFNRETNQQSYKQEKRDYRAEWEDFKKQNTNYRANYKDFNKGSYKGKESEYYKILGLNEGVRDMKVIKLAYRDMMKKYHPDKFANRDVNEQQNLSNMAQKVNEAYSYFEKSCA